MKTRNCRWKCGRKTDRICGICLQCCNERDERDKRIDNGLEAYVPARRRPEYAAYYRPDKPKRRLSDGQRLALAKARAAKSLKQLPRTGLEIGMKG